MKCYNHPEKHGAAICKSCGRSICHDCLQELEGSIVCNRKSCARSLSEQKRFNAGQKAHLQNLKRLNILGSIFSLGMGILFIFFSTRGFGLVYDYIFLLGIGFIAYGTVALLVNMIIFFKKAIKQ